MGTCHVGTRIRASHPCHGFKTKNPGTGPGSGYSATLGDITVRAG